MGKLDELLPEARPLFERFLASLDGRGYRYKVLEAYRSAEAQAAYYAQGREPPREVNRLRGIAGLHLVGAEEAERVITHARRSVHQDRRAADVVPVIDGMIPWDYAKHRDLWEAFGRLGMEAGLAWGGTWEPLLPCGLGWDPPHYQHGGRDG